MNIDKEIEQLYELVINCELEIKILKKIIDSNLQISQEKLENMKKEAVIEIQNKFPNNTYLK
jgi:hypothetical protein